MYVLIGTDRFSYEDYPIRVDTDRDALRGEADKRNASQPEKQPGGLHDVFSVIPLADAMRRLDMTRDELITIANTLYNANTDT